MPIAKIPIVHNFGIISRTHQEEIKQKILEKDVENRHRTPIPRSSPESSVNPSSENLHEVVFKLQNENEELLLLQHERLAKDVLKQIQFKLSSMQTKNTVETLKSCWKDLASLVTCRHPRIIEESLKLLKVSLVVSPLSKQIIKSLLDVALSILQVMVTMNNDDVVTKQHSNNELLAEVGLFVFIRLYYHHMASDLEKLPESHHLEGMYLINKGLSKLLPEYENKPFIWMYMVTINFVVYEISKGSAKKVEDFISTLEGDKLKKKEGEIQGEKESNEHKISTLLWNCLCLWKSVSRQHRLAKHVIGDIKQFDFAVITPQHPHWVEVIISILILAECAKLKIEYLNLFIDIAPSGIPRKKPDVTWSVALQLYYIRCLSDVGLHGMTTDIVIHALLGDKVRDGMASFLQRSGDDSNGWRVRYTAYQCLYEVYMNYKKGGSIKESVRNAIWQVLQKFQEKERNTRVLAINKFEEKEMKTHCENLVVKKIATNLSIIYLPLQNEKRRKDPKKERTKVLSNKSNAKESPRAPVKSKINNSRTTNDPSATVTSPSSSSSSEEAWSTMKTIAAQHLSQETKQDEKEIPQIQNNLREMGLEVDDVITTPSSGEVVEGEL